MDEVNGFVRDRDNGFVQKAEVGGFEVELMYQPPALQAYSHWVADASENPEKLVKDFDDVLNFSLRIKHSSNTPFDELVNDASGEKLAYLIGSISQQFEIEYGDSSSMCLFHHFERDYGLSPYGVINMAFKRPSTDQLVFVYDDLLFNMGPVRFHVPLKKLDESFKVNY